MPYKAHTECRVPRCPGYQTQGGYCAAHQHLVTPGWGPDPAYSPDCRNDNRTFRRLRAAWLMGHPLCTLCRQPGNILDHIRPHRGDRDLFWSQDNWQTLCRQCHDRKTRSEIGARQGSVRVA